MAHKKRPEQTRRPNRGLITELPADGPDNRAPKWPLDKMRKGEHALWRTVWKLPQAALWHQVRCERIVARYVRIVVRAEDLGGNGSGTTWQGEVRQLEDRLGLSPRSMHLLNLRVVDGTGNQVAPISDLEAYRQAVGIDQGGAS